jgi:two-component system KDP operon response regulator KdpE
MSPHILVVEDSPPILRSLEMILQGHGYSVATAITGEGAFTEFERRPPDVVLLDLMLPDIDGLEVARRVRLFSAVPLIVLSARGEETTKVAALDLGVDDYMTKPFGAQELLARVRVALRHSAGRATSTFECGDVALDVDRRLVSLHGDAVVVTPREYEVLKVLVANRDRVLTHGAILREVWGEDYVGEAQYLRNIILSLRRKLEDDPAHPRRIVTEPGIGYSMRSEPDLWPSRR